MNKNKLLKSLVGTAALTISLSGVANTYALAAEADNAGGEVNKPASNLVVDNKEDKSQTPDVEVNKEKGEANITFKDKDGNPTETKTVDLGEVEKADEKAPAENEEADEKAEDKADEKQPAENEKESPAEDEKVENEKAENDKSEEVPTEDGKAGDKDDEQAPAENGEENDKADEKGVDEQAPVENGEENDKETPVDEEQPAEDGESEKVGTEPRIVFSVKDGEPLKINVGSTWNPFNHAAAIDSEDGNLTDKIEYEGDVDVYTPGTYEVTYTITDSDGNEVSEVLTVQVGEGAEEEKGAKDDCNTCDNGGVKVNVDNENTLNGEVKNSGEVQAGEVNEENKTEKDEGKGEGEGEGEKPAEEPKEKDENKEKESDDKGDNKGGDKAPVKEPDTDNNEGEGEGNQPSKQPEGDEKSDDEKSKDNKVTVVENDDNGKGSGEKVYDSSDVTKDQKKGDLPDTGVENTSNAGLIASIGAMFAAMGAFLFGRRKSSDKQ